jgi:nitroreductase
MIPEPVERLVEFAVKAPSGDNAQPWRFAYRPETGILSLEIDESRVDSPKSIWRFVARLSCGAAMENLLRAAPCLGLEATLLAPGDGEICRLRLSPASTIRHPPDVLDVLARRTTNRSIYPPAAISPQVAQRLEEATPCVGGVRTFWIWERRRIDELAGTLYELDAAMYGIRLIWQSIERRIRFDRPWKEEVAVGLSRGALALPRLKLLAIRCLGCIPHPLLCSLGIVRAFSRRTLGLVRSAQGLCCIVADDDRPETDILAGRLVESAWLALTAEGISAHPMNTVALMEHAISQGEPELRRSVEAASIHRLIEKFHALVPEAAGRRSVFVMRFGLAPAPMNRNGRLPIGEVLCIRTRTDAG